MAEMPRIYIVVPGIKGLDVPTIRGRLKAMFGVAFARSPLVPSAEELKKAREGATIYRFARIPIGAIGVWLTLRPWTKQIPTGQTDPDGNPIYTAERLGTLVDVVFELGTFDVQSLEAALLKKLGSSQLTTASGRTIQVMSDQLGIKLVPANSVQDPSVSLPVWSAPKVVEDPEPPSP